VLRSAVLSRILVLTCGEHSREQSWEEEQSAIAQDHCLSPCHTVTSAIEMKKLECHAKKVSKLWDT